jgi:hypothetical protein
MHLTAFELFVRAAIFGLAIAGVAGLALAANEARKGRPYRGGRHPRRLAIVAGGLFVCAGVARLVVHHRPAKAITETHFQSDDLPALALDAPTGWVLEFEPKAGALKAVRRQAPEEGAVMITSSLTKDDVVLQALMDRLTPLLARQGFTVQGAAVAANLGGVPAQLLVARGSDGGELCNWYARRGKHFISSIQCASHTATSCRDACAPVLDRIRWIEPEGVSRSDL